MKRGYSLVILALLLAACGTAASPTSTSAPATSTAAPIAEGAPTSAPATTAPAAPTAAPAEPTAPPAAPTAAPATAAPAASPAASGVVPVVDPYQGFLLGGARDGAWLTQAEIAPLLSGNETYTLYGPTAAAGELSGSAPALVGVPCQEQQKVTLSGGSRDDLIALAGPWNALPRVPEQLPADSPAYQEAVAALLREQGLAEPEVRITRILRVDLNADGVDEVLLTATRYTTENAPTAAAGDYSIVLLRTLVNEVVQTTVIDKDIYPAAIEFAAPLTFTLRGTADLNGDGVLEVLIDSDYYEGGSLQVYAVDGPQVRLALQAGCGV